MNERREARHAWLAWIDRCLERESLLSYSPGMEPRRDSGELGKPRCIGYVWDWYQAMQLLIRDH